MLLQKELLIVLFLISGSILWQNISEHNDSVCQEQEHIQLEIQKLNKDCSKPYKKIGLFTAKCVHTNGQNERIWVKNQH